MTVRKIASPGAVAYHHASGRNSRDSAIVRPHSGVGGGGPRPRKPRAAAVRIVTVSYTHLTLPTIYSV